MQQKYLLRVLFAHTATNSVTTALRAASASCNLDGACELGDLRCLLTACSEPVNLACHRNHGHSNVDIVNNSTIPVDEIHRLTRLAVRVAVTLAQQ